MENQQQQQVVANLAPGAAEELSAVVADAAYRKPHLDRIWRFFNRPVNQNVPAIDIRNTPLPSSERLARSLKETSAFDTEQPIIKDETIFYLAYGSNMCFETFQGKRGIRPLSAINVIVPELKLTFDLAGIPYNEPCFANTAYRTADPKKASLDPDVGLYPTEDVTMDEHTHLLAEQKEQQSSSDRPLIGIVYEITAADYAHVIATEGPTYTDVLVTCNALPNPGRFSDAEIPDFPFKAHTLLGPPKYARHSPSGKPSQPSLRYLTLLRNGAQEHNLPKQWQDYLHSLKHYRTISIRQKIAQKAFLVTWGPVIIFLFALRAIFGKVNDGKGPKWLQKLFMLFFKIVWTSYDYFWRPVFGDGERTEEHGKV